MGYWQNTAISVTWDDWGGWYDHEPPAATPRPFLPVAAPKNATFFLQDKRLQMDPNGLFSLAGAARGGRGSRR